MDFHISEELEQMRLTVREFMEQRVEPLASQIEESDEVPKDLLIEAKGLGLFGASIPEEYGGIGLGMLGRCVLNEELGRGHHGFAGIIGNHIGISSMGIVHFGTEEHKRRYLPRMASGEIIGAFALTEPNAGSDAAALQTTAVRKGDFYLLNGTKQFVTNAPIAGVMTVFAATDPSRGPRGISSFLVEPGFPGVRLGKNERTMGLRGSAICQLILEDCQVPVENLLGKEGEGFTNALKILIYGRTGLAARCVGTSQKLIELALDYACGRIQFKRPIAQLQGIQFMLADMAAETEAAKWLVYRAACLIDEGRPAVKEAAMAKLIASETLGRVVDRALQIHGGYGYLGEYPVERYYRDARVTRLYEGTSEVQRQLIAQQLLKARAG